MLHPRWVVFAIVLVCGVVTPLFGDEITASVSVGRRTLLVLDERRLAIVEPNSTDAIDLRLDPPARGRLTPVVLGDLLMVAEDGVGIRFLQIMSSHHHGHFELIPVANLPLTDKFIAAAGTVRTAYVASEAGRLYEINSVAMGGPRVVREFAFDGSVHALAANANRLVALGANGLTAYRIEDDRVVISANDPSIQGLTLQMNGRVINITGPGGSTIWIDRSESSQTHMVTVGNDFFSPVNLTVAVNDSVQWSMAALGGFHNVKSCVPEINGCLSQTANETFTSGPVAGPPWLYTYQFTENGINRYVCVSHLPFMTGTVFVGVSSGLGRRLPPGDVGFPVPDWIQRPASSPQRTVHLLGRPSF